MLRARGLADFAVIGPTRITKYFGLARFRARACAVDSPSRYVIAGSRQHPSSTTLDADAQDSVAHLRKYFAALSNRSASSENFLRPALQFGQSKPLTDARCRRCRSARIAPFFVLAAHHHLTPRYSHDTCHSKSSFHAVIFTYFHLWQ